MVFTFWFTESVVPASQSTARTIEQGAIKGKKESVLTKRNNLFVKGTGNRFYYTQSYFSDRQEMVFPTILIGSNDGSGVAERIEADRAKLVQGARGLSWEFIGAEHWILMLTAASENMKNSPAPTGSRWKRTSAAS